jgi:ribosomal protein L11 methyltransferase
LDVGTGTGILAIVASKCNGNDINAIDMCPEAVKVAKSNFISNGCASINIKVLDARRIKSKKKYDYVSANIITHDLIAMAEKLISLVKPGQYLAVSGISLSSYDLFRKAYARYPLRCVKIEKGEEWVAVLYKKFVDS